jgi:type IV pilus assembly protein PilC
MNPRTKSNAYFSLAQMVAAGMPIVRSTSTVAKGRHNRFGRALLKVSKDIEKGGMLLADAMRSHPRAFSPMDVMVVEVADNSGNLPEGLRMLANWYELTARTSGIILRGIIMPLVILHVAAFVYPLPGLVTSGFNTSIYFRSVITTLLIFYIPIIFLAILVKLSGSRGALRKVIDYVAFHIPVLGGAIQAMALSRYCMAFGMMARAGVSVITAAESSARLCGNALMEKRLAPGAQSARLGNPVVDGFSSWLPYEFTEMWRVGEETGDIGTTTERLARTYEEQMIHRFTMVARALPWILYALVSLMIIYMIFSMAGVYIGMINNAGNLD